MSGQLPAWKWRLVSGNHVVERDGDAQKAEEKGQSL